MIKFLLFSTLILFSNPKDFELNIYKYSLEGDTLYLYYSIKNNTDSIRTFVKTDYSTFLYIQSLTVLIMENDTLPLHIQNPFPGFPSKTINYGTINTHDSICEKIEIQLNKLYSIDKMFPNPSHQIRGKYSLQLIYLDEYVRHGTSRKIETYNEKGIKTKNYKPISDSLYSNIIYIDRK